MYDYDLAEVERLSGLREPERRRLAGYYSALSEQARLEAHKLSGDLAGQHRDSYDKAHRSEFYYAMQLLALQKMNWLETAQGQRQDLSPEEARQITVHRVARIKDRKQKSSPKRRLIEIRFFEEIKQLREIHKLSWREISEYVRKNHRQRFSHGYLQQVYQELSERS